MHRFLPLFTRIMPACLGTVAVLTIAALSSGCSFAVKTLIAADVAKSRLKEDPEIRGSKAIPAFEKRCGMTAAEAYALVQEYVKKEHPAQRQPVTKPIIVRGRFFFQSECTKAAAAVSAVDERGYYVDPATKTVTKVKTSRMFHVKR